MSWTWNQLASLEAEVGEEIYLLDLGRFAANYRELLDALRERYPSSNVAYSYKTNYVPRLCELVHEWDGLAEVVSEMEFELAERVGVPGPRIVLNGPLKRTALLERALATGALVNLDAPYEVALVEAFARRRPDVVLNVGIRCHVAAGGASSRFGFDTAGADFAAAIARLINLPGCRHINLHAHVLQPNRQAADFAAVARALLDACARIPVSHAPSVIDVGGGFFSRMPAELAAQFGVPIPSCADYGRAIGDVLRGAYPREPRPTLLVEPGMALVADAMSLAAKVVATRSTGSRRLALLATSVYSARPTGSTRTMPFSVVRRPGAGTPGGTPPTDLVGYTCMEHDCLVRGTTKPIDVGDFVVFEQTGAYTNVLRPSFIEPGPPVVAREANGGVAVVKRRERMTDVFASYRFSGAAGSQQ
jgi:diaminopimelate decarboxylase